MPECGDLLISTISLAHLLGSLQILDSGLDCGLDYGLISFKATQPLFSAFSVIFIIMLSVISASSMEPVHESMPRSMQTGEDYSNTTVNNQYFTWEIFVIIMVE